MEFDRPSRRILTSLLMLMALWMACGPARAREGAAGTLEERVEKLERKAAADDESPGDRYVSEFGGRLQADWTFNADQSSVLRSNLGPAEDGFEFRRLRLYVEGPIGQAITYKLQVDFAGEFRGDDMDVKDAYVSVSGMGVLPDLKIGHFKEPFSLDELTSSKYITFLSRSALSDGFTPEYNPGVQTAFHAPMAHLTVGVFNQQDGQSPATDGSYNLTGRLTGPVHYAREGRSVVHLGLAGRMASDQSGFFDVDLEPEVHKGDPEYLEVDFPSEGHTALGLEIAAVMGPFSIQSEWARQSVSTPSGVGADPDLDSYYALVSYFLTGEHRPYDVEDGTFGRLKPKAPFPGGRRGYAGYGAWEVAARWSGTDFTEARGLSPVDEFGDGDGVQEPGADDPTVAFVNNLADRMNVLTLGLNWYPHAHARWMLNYVDAEQEGFGGDAQWVTTRFQVDF